VVLKGGDGEHLWFLGNLGTIKAARERTGSWAMLELVAPDGYQPPLHVHEDEDEAFYILEGALTITIGESEHRAETGAFVLSPKGVPHTIRAEGRTRWLQLAPSGRFADLMRELGEPADAPTLPEAGGPPDFGRLREIAAKHGITILGPPPGADG
jgi:mannose-6-phosphate isomerase-like protein (cupin superfamily)